jgi:exodeoxyribonuclease VII small subunit
MVEKREKNENYRALQNELQDILLAMQREDLDIDEAIKNYEKGLIILKRLERYLTTAENKVIELKAKFGDV